jgi:hypothetical protein
MRTRGVLVFAGALLLLSGCVTVHREEASQIEHLLVAAGFQRRPADTAERATDLATMPALKLIARREGDDVKYIFADPYSCHCLYVGGSKEYSAYQRLVSDKALATGRFWADEESRGLGRWW